MSFGADSKKISSMSGIGDFTRKFTGKCRTMTEQVMVNLALIKEFLSTIYH